MTSPAAIASVERRTELRAGPERVWRALTDPDELRGWFGHGAELDLVPGGHGCFEWDGHGGFDVRVEAVEAPVYLAWRWGSQRDVPVEDGPSTLVEFRLTPRADGGTTLDVRESGFARPESRDQNDEGWAEELGELVEYVDGEPWRAGITRRIDLHAAPDTVWQAFADLDRWAAWWGPLEGFEARAGSEGWFVWPQHGGRFAGRIETYDPEGRRFSWRWVTSPEMTIADAASSLLTEWSFEPGEDGGTIVRLRETGFASREDWDLNRIGWSDDEFPKLRRLVGDAV